MSIDVSCRTLNPRSPGDVLLECLNECINIVSGQHFVWVSIFLVTDLGKSLRKEGLGLVGQPGSSIYAILTFLRSNDEFEVA